jgi:predicted glycoside hydrolase/deacetylase ChbG (UPF0249 family)
MSPIVTTTKTSDKWKTISICADDFGQSKVIDDGIHQLALAGRISAVSCLSDSPYFAADIQKLNGEAVDIGLHLNFTQPMGQDGFHLPLGQLIFQCHLRQIDPKKIELHIERQFDQFEGVTGKLPDFVDGHQHIHQLPIIREALFSVLSKRYSSQKPWIRSTKSYYSSSLPIGATFKSWTVGALGNTSLISKATGLGYKCNHRFLGVYNFQKDKSEYDQLLRSWLEMAQDGDLLMCHPASDVTDNDAFGFQRRREFDALMSDYFGDLLYQYKIQLGCYR